MLGMKIGKARIETVAAMLQAMVRGAGYTPKTMMTHGVLAVTTVERETGSYGNHYWSMPLALATYNPETGEMMFNAI